MERFAILAQALIGSLLLAGCSPTLSGSPTPVGTPASLRIVNGSAYGLTSNPVLGNPIDVYIYAVGTTRPTQPAFNGVTNPAAYKWFAPGNYQIDVFPQGAAQSPPTLSEVVSLSFQERLTVVVAGERAAVLGNSPLTLQLVNFIEPTEIAGQTALVFHQAAPSFPNIGIGVVPPGVTPAYGPSIPQLFALSLQMQSGPASVGSAAGGEYWISPTNLTSSSITFGAGVPASGQGTPPSVFIEAHATIAIAPGAHTSVFILDAYGPDNQSVVNMTSVTDP